MSITIEQAVYRAGQQDALVQLERLESLRNMLYHGFALKSTPQHDRLALCMLCCDLARDAGVCDTKEQAAARFEAWMLA